MIQTNDRATWVKGPQAQCSVLPVRRPKPYRLILLGAPGIGKGTQAELLCKQLGACHLSTGDLFRAMKTYKESDRTPAMVEALEYVKKGCLVPDRIVINMIGDRMRCLRCPNGFVMDGFPRTVPQAEAFTELVESAQVPVNAVINYELPINEVIARLSGRRTCADCRAIFHVVHRPPKIKNLCDHCGGQLYQREDDHPDTIRVRMEVHEKTTEPVTTYYRKKGLLTTILAEGDSEAVFYRSLISLGALDRPAPRQ